MTNKGKPFWRGPWLVKEAGSNTGNDAHLNHLNEITKGTRPENPLTWHTGNVSCSTFHFPFFSPVGLKGASRLGTAHSSLRTRRMPLHHQCSFRTNQPTLEKTAGLAPPC